MRLRERRTERQLQAAIDRGRSLLAEGGDDHALDFIEDAARRFPQSAEIQLQLASALLAFTTDKVAAQAAKAAELAPDDPVIQVRAGHMLLNEGDLGAARACAARAEELADGEFILLADVEGLSGRIAARDGNYALAEEKLRSALQREPEWSSHWLNFVRFLWARGRDEEALTVIDESLDQVRESDRDLLERLRGEITDEV